MKRIFALLLLLAAFASAQTDSTDILITVREDGDTTQVGRWRAGMPVLIRDSWDGWGDREKLSNKFVIIRVGIAKAWIDSFLVNHTDSTTGLRRKYQLSRAAIQFVKNNRDQNNVVRVTPAQLRNAFKRANRLRRFGEPQRMGIISKQQFIRWRNMLIGATPTSATVNTDGGGDYTSLAAAEAGEQKDLVTANEQLTISCSGTTADITVTVFDGWTTDATRLFKVVGDGQYTISVTGNAITVGTTLTATFNKLKITSTGYGIHFTADVDAALNVGKVENCTLNGGSVGIRWWGLWYGISVNNVIYDYTTGLEYVNSGTRGYASNTTVNNATTGYKTLFAVAFKNCMAMNCTDGFSGGGGDYNLSNVAADAPGANSLNGVSVVFTNANSGDFSVKSGSANIDAGTPDTSGLGLPLLDNLGNDRIIGNIVDIGAVEYVLTLETQKKKNRFNGFGRGFNGGWKK